MFVNKSAIKKDVLRFIELYKSHEILWNMNLSSYRRNDLKMKACETIATETGISVEEVKKNIESLQTSYSAEKEKGIKSKKAGCDTDSIYIPNVFWYSELAFLDASLIGPNTVDNSKQQNATLQSTTLDSETNDSCFSANDFSFLESLPTRCTRKRKHSPEPNNKLNDVLDELIAINKPVSAFEAFGKSVSSQLKDLPVESAYEAMADIQTLLTKKKLQYIQSKACDAENYQRIESNTEPKASIDVIGVCPEVGEAQTITARTTNKEITKRDLTLVDSSETAVTLTIWGKDAVNFEGHFQPVVLIKGGRINELNGGKSTSLGNAGILKINPDIPEGHKLRGWFDNGGGENITNMVSARTGGGVGFSSDWRTFREARNLCSGEIFQTKGVIKVVRSDNLFYKACPQAECNKKVDENKGRYRCDRCNAVFPNFKYRLLLNMAIGDWTSNRWVTCFGDAGEQLLGCSVQKFIDAIESKPSEAEEILDSIKFHSFVFKLRFKAETYDDMIRNELIVQTATPVSYREYNKYLINNLKKLTGINKN